jgi:hypothetical protein
MKKLCIGIVLGLMAVAATASAQPGVEVPAGITTDRGGPELELATLDIGFVNFTGADDLVYAARMDFYGQLLGPVGEHLAGVYVALPYGRIELDIGDEAISGLGNLELGGLLVTATDEDTDLVFRGGVVLGLDEGENYGTMAPIVTGYGRLTDWMTTYPGVSWLRTSASLLHASAPYFLRADLGLDVPLDDDMDFVDPFARFNLAAGVHLGSVALLGELATVTLMDDEDTDNALSTFALTARHPSGRLSPCVGLVFPLDEELKNLVDFVFVVGIRSGDPG